MFGWLTNWFGDGRNIFRYWDGKKQRAVDPAVAWRRMFEFPDCDIEKDFGPATCIGANGERVDFDPAAQQRVLLMTRDMFKVQEWDENVPGLTVDETFELLLRFLHYMNALKKKRGPLPTPSGPSDSTSFPEEGQSSTTRPASDSSSTSNEWKSDEHSSFSKPLHQL